MAGVSGGAAILNDYGSATKSRLPLVIGAIVLITFLMLVAILRAPLLAALAVGLNLLSVAAAIGVVTLICKIPAGYPLGGHPYIDTVGAAAIFGVTFGLSIDYAVFLLARMRERRDAGADNAAAIAFGLEKTAGVITGAAAIMAAVFVSFAAAPIATVSQMGVGLTVAILLDATVVRIVLLPALMLLLGDRVWHVPTALERLLPRSHLHGAPSGDAGRVRESRDTGDGDAVSREQQRSGAPADGSGVAGRDRAGRDRPAPRSSPDRAEYVSRLESICKPGVEATQRAVRGVRSDIRAERLAVAAGKLVERRADLRRHRAARSPPFRARRSTRRSSPSGSATSGSRSPIWAGRPRLCARRRILRYQHNAVRFVHNGNLANDVVIAFGFNYCRFKFSRFNEMARVSAVLALLRHEIDRGRSI